MVIVTKFGGSSFKDIGGYTSAGGYILEHNKHRRIVAVVSARSGRSNDLIDSYDQCAGNESASSSFCDGLLQQDLNLIGQLESHAAKEYAKTALSGARDQKKKFLMGGERDAYLASGENDSGIVLASVIIELGGKSAFYNGKEVGVLARRINGHPIIDVDESSRRIRDRLQSHLSEGVVPIVGGFVGEDDETKRYLILGRNTTDDTSILVGIALGADYCENIKEVDGVFRIDDHREYGILPYMSYDEAMKLTARGAKMLNSTAARMAAKYNMPIIIKNYKSSGTRISRASSTTQKNPVAAIDVISVCSITIEDPAMDTLSGIGYSATYSGILRELGIPKITGAEDTKITFTIAEKDREHEGTAVKTRIQNGLNKAGWYPIVDESIESQFTIVGDSMQGPSRALARICQCIGDAGASVDMLVQAGERYSPSSVTFSVGSEYKNAVIDNLCKDFFADFKTEAA